MNVTNPIEINGDLYIPTFLLSVAGHLIYQIESTVISFLIQSLDPDSSHQTYYSPLSASSSRKNSGAIL